MKENGKNILLGVLIVGLIGMTVAYAALSTSLNISGTVSVPTTTWDIRISGLTLQSNVPSAVTGQVNTANAPASVASTNNTAVSVPAITLNQPGDKVIYDFTIENYGSIDAKLSSFTSSLTKASTSTGNITQEEINSKFTYAVSCNPTQESNADFLNKSTDEHHSAACTLTIQWNEAGLGSGQASQTAGQDQTYHQDAVTLDYSATWVYVQK